MFVSGIMLELPGEQEKQAKAVCMCASRCIYGFQVAQHVSNAWRSKVT